MMIYVDGQECDYGQCNDGRFEVPALESASYDLLRIADPIQLIAKRTGEGNFMLLTIEESDLFRPRIDTLIDENFAEQDALL